MIPEGSCDKTTVRMLKMSFVITGINYILKYTKIENIFFLNDDNIL